MRRVTQLRLEALVSTFMVAIAVLLIGLRWHIPPFRGFLIGAVVALTFTVADLTGRGGDK